MQRWCSFYKMKFLNFQKTELITSMAVTILWLPFLILNMRLPNHVPDSVQVTFFALNERNVSVHLSELVYRLEWKVYWKNAWYYAENWRGLGRGLGLCHWGPLFQYNASPFLHRYTGTCTHPVVLMFSQILCISYIKLCFDSFFFRIIFQPLFANRHTLSLYSKKY